MFAIAAEITGFFALMADLAVRAIGYAPSAFMRASTSAEAQSAALFIAFLAGVSEMLGQSVILVVNRTPLYRFVASLAFTGASYAITVVTWSAAVLATAPLTRVGAIDVADFAAVTGVLALAFAPRLLGVFSIAPYFGAAFAVLLEAWSMSLAIFGLHVGMDLPIGAAVFCAGAGFIGAYLFRSFAGRLFAKPLGQIHRAVAGSALDKTPQQILDDVFARLHDEARS